PAVLAMLGHRARRGAARSRSWATSSHGQGPYDARVRPACGWWWGLARDRGRRRDEVSSRERVREHCWNVVVGRERQHLAVHSRHRAGSGGLDHRAELRRHGGCHDPNGTPSTARRAWGLRLHRPVRRQLPGLRGGTVRLAPDSPDDPTSVLGRLRVYSGRLGPGRASDVARERLREYDTVGKDEAGVFGGPGAVSPGPFY